MKKSIIILAVLLLLSGCSGEDAVISALPKYETGIFYTSGGFQDYTGYGVYTYGSLSIDTLTDTEYFSEVTASDVLELLDYIENFEEWVSVTGGELEEHYHFDASAVSEGDCFYIYTKYDPSGVYSGKFDHYTLYFFDMEQQILYYFHNNI